MEGPKKVVRFFNNYVIEVKAEKKQEKITIYDFDNKINVYSMTFPQIFQIEVETEERKQSNKHLPEGALKAKAIYMQVMDKSGKLAVYQLTEMENNLKIEILLKKKLYKEA